MATEINSTNKLTIINQLNVENALQRDIRAKIVEEAVESNAQNVGRLDTLLLVIKYTQQRTLFNPVQMTPTTLTFSN
jgi:hypothetical protein